MTDYLDIAATVLASPWTQSLLAALAVASFWKAIFLGLHWTRRIVWAGIKAAGRTVRGVARFPFRLFKRKPKPPKEESLWDKKRRNRVELKDRRPQFGPTTLKITDGKGNEIDPRKGLKADKEYYAGSYPDAGKYGVDPLNFIRETVPSDSLTAKNRWKGEEWPEDSGCIVTEIISYGDMTEIISQRPGYPNHMRTA